MRERYAHDELMRSLPCVFVVVDERWNSTWNVIQQLFFARNEMVVVGSDTQRVLTCFDCLVEYTLVHRLP